VSFTPEIDKLPEWKGKAYRVDIENWGISNKATAADTIRFEEEELKNEYNLPEALMKELELFHHRDISWVGRSKEDVADYLSAGMTRKDISIIEFPPGSKIVAEDGFDGFLVLRGDAIAEHGKSEKA